MDPWQLLIALVAQFASIGGLMLITLQSLNKHIDRRFSEAEERRVEATQHWQQRLTDRDLINTALTHRVDASHAEHADIRDNLRALNTELAAVRTELAEDYVRRDYFMTVAGRLNITLDKIHERLEERANHD